MSKLSVNPLGSRLFNFYDGVRGLGTKWRSNKQIDAPEKFGKVYIFCLHKAIGKKVTLREGNACDIKTSNIAMRIFFGILAFVMLPFTLIGILLTALSKSQKKIHQEALNSLKVKPTPTDPKKPIEVKQPEIEKEKDKPFIDEMNPDIKPTINEKSNEIAEELKPILEHIENVILGDAIKEKTKLEDKANAEFLKETKELGPLNNYEAAKKAKGIADVQQQVYHGKIDQFKLEEQIDKYVLSKDEIIKIHTTKLYENAYQALRNKITSIIEKPPLKIVQKSHEILTCLEKENLLSELEDLENVELPSGDDEEEFEEEGIDDGTVEGVDEIVEEEGEVSKNK